MLAAVGSPTFGQQPSLPMSASDVQQSPEASPSKLSTISTWTEKAEKMWHALPLVFIVTCGLGGVAASCVGIAFQWWLVTGVSAATAILSRLLYLLQWEHLALTQSLLDGATVPVVVQPPGATKQPAPRAVGDKRNEPMSELDLTGFAGSLGFHVGRQQALQGQQPGSNETASGGGAGTLRKLKQTALAKEYLLVCSALNAYRAAYGPMEPEPPKAALTIDVNAEPTTPRSVGGMPSPNAARAAKQSADAEKNSEGSDKQKMPTSPGGYGKMSSEKPQEEKKEPQRPKTSFGLFGSR